MDLSKFDFRIFRRWWSLWGTLPVWVWVKAEKAMHIRDFITAEALYEKGISLYRNHPAIDSAMLSLARCYFKNHKFDEAERALNTLFNRKKYSKEAVIRYSILKFWTGRSLEAAFCIRKSFKYLPPDIYTVSLFIIAVAEGDGPPYLLKEALSLGKDLSKSGSDHALFITALARLSFVSKEREKSRERLSPVLSSKAPPVEALILSAELYMAKAEFRSAFSELRTALNRFPNHPRLLSLIAECYLRSPELYNPDYALQLAKEACRNSGWQSPREAHVLANAYCHCRDKVSALLVASKASELGKRLIGPYPKAKALDQLIETLCSGTLS